MEALVESQIDPFIITPANPNERNFVADSWRLSWRDTPKARHMPLDAFRHWSNSIIRSYLGGGKTLNLRPEDTILVARDALRPELILGWLLFTDLKPGLVVNYVYTKRNHRRQGVALALLIDSITRTEEGDYFFSIHSRLDKFFARHGFTFKPIKVKPS